MVSIQLSELRRGLSSVLRAASDSDDHPTLKQVQFWHRGDKLYLAAVNQFWLAIWTTVSGGEEDIQRFAISVDDARFLCGIMALDGKTEHLEVDMSKPSLTVSRGDTSDPNALDWSAGACKLMGGQLGPDPEEILGKVGRGSIPYIGLNAKLLADVDKAFRAGGELKPGEKLEFTFGSTERDAVIITCPDVVELVVALAPCAIGAPCECELIMKTAQAIADKEGVTTSIQVPGQDGAVIAKPSKSSRKRAHS